MARKGENIRKRKDGRWEARYMKGRKPDGKICYGYLYAPTYREVREKKRLMVVRMEEEQKNHLAGVRCPDDRIQTVGTLWMEAAKNRVKYTTYCNYHLLMKNHILPAFGDSSIRKLSSVQIGDFVRGLQKEGKKTGTIRVILGILKSILHFAGELNCFPEETLRFPKITAPRSSPRIMSAADYQKLGDYLDTSEQPFEFGLLVCMCTGIRVGELCGLRWEDFDLANGSLAINRTVTRIENPDFFPGSTQQRTLLLVGTPKSLSSIRQIPLPDRIIRKARSCRREDSSYLLTGTEKCMEPRTVQRRYERLLRRCGIAPVNLHAMRHQLSSRWIAYGFDVKALSEILGHASTKTTLDIYVHSSHSQKRNYLNQVLTLQENSEGESREQTAAVLL